MNERASLCRWWIFRAPMQSHSLSIQLIYSLMAHTARAIIDHCCRVEYIENRVHYQWNIQSIFVFRFLVQGNREIEKQNNSSKFFAF